LSFIIRKQLHNFAIKNCEGALRLGNSQTRLEVSLGLQHLCGKQNRRIMELNFNSVEMLAAFYVDSGKVFKDDVDICPVIIDKKLKQQVEDSLLV
jgi:hypothetical protein